MKRKLINKKTNFFVKLPLYLGISVFVLTVVVSSVTIGERGSVFTANLKAKNDLPKLSLIYTQPQSITLSLVGSQKIKGLDLVLKYEPGVIEILPSTLSGFSQNFLTGGETDPAAGTFTFSALSEPDDFQNNLIASFKINVSTGIYNPLQYISIDRAETKVYILDNESSLREIPYEVVLTGS